MAEPNDRSTVSIASNGGSRPVPDPTELTDRAIARLERSLTAWVEGQFEVRDQRLRGIDEATKLRLQAIDHIPMQISDKVGRLGDVQDEKFSSIAKQFTERDTRAERESRDNKVAVDAAFAAQKEAAAKQDEGNAKAIDKSERATAETIKTNQELGRAVTDGLTKDVDALKLAVNAIQAAKVGAVEVRTAATDNRSAIFGVLGVVFGAIVALVTVFAFIAPHLK